MNFATNKPRNFGLTRILAAALITLAGATAATASTLTTYASVTVNTGNYVPDFSTVPLDGPTGDIEVTLSGNPSVATATLSPTSPTSFDSQSSVITLSYVNNANFAFDIYQVFFDFAVLTLYEFDDAFDTTPFDGVAYAYLVQYDVPLTGGTGAYLSVAGADQLPPLMLPAEYQLEAFTTSGDFRLNPGESATFVVELYAEVAAIPLPLSLPLLGSALGLMGLAGRRKSRAA